MENTVRLALLGLLLVSCGDDEKKPAAGGGESDEQLASGFVARLRECDILSPGEYNDHEIQDDFDRCLARCTIEARCQDLEAICSERLSSNAFFTCSFDCEDSTFADQFECDDGARIPHSSLCDLVEDCDGGEDEGRPDCGTYTCDDGEVLLASEVKCDGVEDCGDGSDEKGCATFCQ
jgi:hypothetical protein